MSFLLRNQQHKERLARKILAALQENPAFEVITPAEELNAKIQRFAEGEKEEDKLLRTLDLNTQVEIAGSRRSRLVIAELSDELLQLSFLFFGSPHAAEEWGQLGLKAKDKPAFRAFFQNTIGLLSPVLGTMAYEEDCTELFDTDEPYPSEAYNIKNLSTEKIMARVRGDSHDFEYCWMNACEFNATDNIEVEINLGHLK